MSSELIGWLASGVLVITLGYQVFNQWSSGTSEGVSPWLFVGQLVASVGFAAYSALIGNTVFIVTNSLIALSAITGMGVLFWHDKRERLGPGANGTQGLNATSGTLHHVGLSTDRWEESIDFYTGVLGGREALRFHENGGRVVMLDFAGGCRIELFETARPRGAGDPPGAGTDGNAATPGALVHLALAVDDVERVTRRAAGSGCPVERPPARMRLANDVQPTAGPLVTYSFIRGPSNELIELIRCDA